MYEILKKNFNYSKFKPHQLEIIEASISDKDVLAILQTGHGKSLCYQFLSFVVPGIIIIISPLKSLIYDQVNYLRDKHISVEYLTSDQSDDDKIIIYEKCQNIPGLLLYTTPETIEKNVTFGNVIDDLYKNDKISRIVVDEVHCICTWGHDFRPAYLYLKHWRLQYPKIPISAFTSTATKYVESEIRYHLTLYKPLVIRGGYYRSNLQISVHKYSKQTLSEINTWIIDNNKDNCGIIYCHSKKSCDKVSNYLNRNGLHSNCYYAGLKDRNTVHDDWTNNKFPIIVATIAFGMGIDKRNVRFIIHYNMPQSLENYYQEIGRGGRDGERCDCRLYYSFRDKIIYQKMLPKSNTYWSKYRKIMQMFFYANNNVDCRHTQLCHYLGEMNTGTCNVHCDNCLSDDVFSIKEISRYLSEIYTVLLKYENVTLNLNKTICYLYRELNITDIDKKVYLERIMIWLIEHNYLEYQYTQSITGVDEIIIITDLYRKYINNVKIEFINVIM